MMSPGTFTATGPVSMVIKFAFDLQSNDQLTGGPAWINSEGCDIEAKELDSSVESMKGILFQTRPAKSGSWSNRCLRTVSS